MANGVPTVQDLINPGPNAIQDIAPNVSPFASFAPFLGAGRGIFSALQGDAGGALSAGLGLLGHAILPGIGGIAGGLLGGGLGRAIGGGTTRTGISAQDFSGTRGTFLEGAPFNFGGAISPSGSFRNLSTELANEIQFTNPAIDWIIRNVRMLGQNDLADNIEDTRNFLFNPSPANPAKAREQNQHLFNLLTTSIKFRDSMLQTAQNDPDFSAQFEADTGIPISDFIDEVNRQDQSFLTDELLIPHSNRELDRLITGANKKTGSRGRGTGRSEIDNLLLSDPALAGFMPSGNNTFSRGTGGGRGNRNIETISADEFKKRQDAVVSSFEQERFDPIRQEISGLQQFLNTPGIDISGAGLQFGDLFNQAVINAPVDAGTGLPGGVQPTPTQQPIPPQPPGDPATSGGFPRLPIGQLLRLLPQQQQQPQASDFNLNLPSFDFGQLGGTNIGVESALGSGNIIQNLINPAQQQTLQPASGLPFSPTSGNLFSAKQKSPRGLAFLS